jgi:hypothetical protein
MSIGCRMESATWDEVGLESTEEQELVERERERGLVSKFECLVHTKPIRVITSLWH